MKNHILIAVALLFFIGWGKKDKSLKQQKTFDTIVEKSNEIEIKEVEKPIYNYEQDSDFSKELDLNLLAKVATNLKIKYEDIKIDESNSIRFNDKISFLVITYLAEKDKVSEEDFGNYFEKKSFLLINQTEKL